MLFDLNTANIVFLQDITYNDSRKCMNTYRKNLLCMYA